MIGTTFSQKEENVDEFKENVIKINRVAKVVKGGKRFSFSALVVVGNGKGKVGAGMGKAGEVPDAIRKATEEAKKNIIEAPLFNNTIPHEINFKHGAAKIFLKPAAPGTGIIAGGAVRSVMELAGYKDVLAKSLGSDNQINIVYATIKALQEMHTLKKVCALRGKKAHEIFN